MLLFMFKLRLGRKGEIVIPKKIRESLGFLRDRPVVLTIKEKSAVLSVMQEDIVQKWGERAKKNHQDVSKWLFGDKLYEEEF